LRCAGFYIAVSFVGYDDVAVWRDLARGHLEGRRDGAALEQAFSGAERDRNCHELHLIDKIIFKERPKKICASHYIYIGSVLLFELPYFFCDVAAEEYVGLPIAGVARVRGDVFRRGHDIRPEVRMCRPKRFPCGEGLAA